MTLTVFILPCQGYNLLSCSSVGLIMTAFVSQRNITIRQVDTFTSPTVYSSTIYNTSTLVLSCFISWNLSNFFLITMKILEGLWEIYLLLDILVTRFWWSYILTPWHELLVHINYKDCLESYCHVIKIFWIWFFFLCWPCVWCWIWWMVDG